MNFSQSFLQYFSYEQASDFIIPIVIKSTIVITILIALSIVLRIAKKSITNICAQRNIERHTCLLLNKAVRYSIRILTYIFILQYLGFNVSALLAALGVSGVALSFGMKDTVSNIIAGILIMAYQQFKINDHIKIKDWQGKVIDINIRYTTIENDEMTIFIPNSVLYSATMAIINKN